MHPVIRIINFVVLTLALACGELGPLLSGAILVMVLLVRSGPAAWMAVLPLLRRMRWLWLSLAVVYFWFTPGEPVAVWSELAAPWLPTVEGLALGGIRIAALAVMVMAASLLMQFTPRDQLFAALYWLAAPLTLFGIARERLAVRVALSLAAVAEVQSVVKGLARQPAPAPHIAFKPWRRWGATAAALVDAVVMRAEQAACDDLVLPPRSAPPLWQWSLPFLLTAVMLLAMRIF